jgi:hypothetical protein
MIKRALSNIRLGIGIPLTFPYVPSAFFDSYNLMEKPDYEYIREQNGPVDEMRNNLVRRAKVAGCSHLLMMDVDQIYHPKTFTTLMSHNLPVVGCMIHRRYPPFDPLMYRGEMNEYLPVEDFKEGDLVEVDATGTGCLLMNMEVFDILPDPWFKFSPNPDPDRKGIVGEDFIFCWHLRQAGIPIYVDTSVPAAHITMFEVNMDTYKFFKRVGEVRKEALAEYLKTQKPAEK